MEHTCFAMFNESTGLSTYGQIDQHKNWTSPRPVLFQTETDKLDAHMVTMFMYN